jgi:hypothetical protein
MMKRTCCRIAGIVLLLLCAGPRTQAQTPELRLGIIGADTSHAVEFTRILNDDTAKDHVQGARVVAVYKGGSPDIAASHDRIEGFTAQLRDKWHLQFVEHIQQLCPLVDGILLESGDGRIHLEQFRQAATCRKPIFIDKPLASTLADARAIAQMAAAKHVLWFSASSLRFSNIQTLRSPQLVGAFVWSPGPLEPHHQLDLSWYAVHGIEMLYTLMGPGAVQVTRTYTPDTEVVTGVWKDGRVGTLRASRPYGDYGGVAFYPNNKTAVVNNLPINYAPLVLEIVKFMNTGVPPVSNAETLEMFEFMDAAQQSREQNGIPIKLSSQ